VSHSLSRLRSRGRSLLAIGVGSAVLWAGVPSVASDLSRPHFFRATGTSLYPVAVADLDRDGRPDIVVGSEDHQTVSILYGKRGGGFKPREDYPGGSYPVWITTADFNHDHRPDIAVGEYGTPGSVTVLLSKPGGFRSPDTYPVGDDVYAIDVADLNRDGNRDIATANDNSNDVSILLGRRNGTFRDGGTISGEDGPAGIVAADLNHDHKADLAVLNIGGSSGHSFVDVFLGKGNGNFKSPHSYRAGALDPEGFVPGRFTADRQLDLAVPDCESSPNKVYIMAGTSRGGFKKPHGFRNNHGSCSYESAVADLNHDGRQDVATGIAYGAHTGDISVLYGKRGGKLSAPKLFHATGNHRNWSVAVGRFNGDPRPDLVVPDYDEPRVAVLFGKS
jgi:FG-GAP-like repeat/FG-GAP repeat